MKANLAGYFSAFVKLKLKSLDFALSFFTGAEWHGKLDDESPLKSRTSLKSLACSTTGLSGVFFH